MNDEFHADLDVRGLNCPLPILKTKKQLVTMKGGELLRVRATDPHSVLDFKVFCEKTGNHLVALHEEGEEYHFLLRKKSD